MSYARSRLVVAFSYLAIVLTLWIPFSPRSGMAYETGFAYTSEISTWWNGFLHGADLLRAHTSTFYQISYLLGELFGIGGSFVPYQIVYAALWWTRGLLVFLIGRRLLRGHDVFWYLVGALTLVHASDDTVGWVGQLNQSGYIFWMLAAFYMLVLAFQRTDRFGVRVCLLLAGFFEHMSLWSYESQLLMILSAPVFLLGLYGRPRRRWLKIAAAWYVVPVIYIAVAIARYVRSAGHTYQESVLRKEWSGVSILSDWLFNLSASLKFWAWAGSQSTAATTSQLVLPAVLAVVLFLVGVALLVWLCRARQDKDHGWIPKRRTLWRVMLVGLLLLAMSFPAYLILDSARSLWRTQILSGFGAALVLSSAIGLCASYAPRNWLQIGAVALLGSLVVGYGSVAAVKKTAIHRGIWDRHRYAMARLLHTVPGLKPGTLVILTNVPKDDSSDPFLRNNMWFDMAVRLAYPGALVAGVYYYEDGAPAPGNNLKITPDGRWTLRGNLLPATGGVDAMLVLEYKRGSPPSIMPGLPKFLGVDENAGRLYNPLALIEGGSPAPRALRRYGPLELRD